jgi:hypothetical protein
MVTKAKGQRKHQRNDPQTVGDLVPDPHNRRKRTPRNVAMIADALRSVGAARSIVIDERNEVLAGNGVLEGAAQAGITKLQVVEADGDTIIAVRRRGLSEAQKRDLALYDNRTAELAEWDVSQLAADQAAGEDLAPFFFEKELEALLHPTGAIARGVTGGAPQFVIIVTCQTEVEQTQLLARWMGEGLQCRAVVS